MKYSTALIFTLLLSHSLFSQGRKSPVFIHTIDYFKSQKSGVHSSTSELEILLVGTFHFRSKSFKIPSLEKQIEDFAPEAIFVEEVPPSNIESYKESYRNSLYENPRRGARFYSDAIDSAVSFTGINREEARIIIEKNDGSITDLKDLNEKIKLINALFINADDPNAQLQIALLKKHCKKEHIAFDSIKKKLSPLHMKYRFAMGETKHLSVPLAVRLKHRELYSMDYQKGRMENDSLLEIASKKMVSKHLWKIWKLPYFLKMMNLDRKGPENDEDALRHIKILNQPKTMVNMAKVHEVYLYSDKLEASKIWLKSYQTRNREMMAIIRENTVAQGFNKIVVIVGASHVPYFMYEISEQLPQARIKLLELDKL